MGPNGSEGCNEAMEQNTVESTIDCTRIKMEYDIEIVPVTSTEDVILPEIAQKHSPEILDSLTLYEEYNPSSPSTSGLSTTASSSSTPLSRRILRSEPRSPLREMDVEEPTPSSPLRKMDIEEPAPSSPLREIDIEEPMPSSPLRETDIEEPIPSSPLREIDVEEPKASSPLREIDVGELKPRSPLREKDVGEPKPSSPLREIDVGDPKPSSPLREKDVGKMINYGSDLDSDDDSDDEVPCAPMMLRTMLTEMETPLDENPQRNFVETGIEQSEGHFPRNFFDFQWKPFDELTDPLARRELFNSPYGPVTPCTDPYLIFRQIWDDEILNRIVQETNGYAQEVAAQKMAEGTLGPKSRICYWKETNADEILCYFAIVLAMGVVIKTKLEDYWSKKYDIFYTPGFSAHMSLKRFQLLDICLHFNDNRGMSALLSPSEAKVYKMSPILEHLNSKFQNMYRLGRSIALDESLLQWKGLFSGQFTFNKVASVGLKAYDIYEAHTGYLWRFEVHAHKDLPSLPTEQQSPLDASTSALVLRLMNGLENKGHTLWMDNYYQSPALARRLKSIGFDVVGTLRTNRQFVPDEITNLTKSNMYPGQMVGYTSGDVDVMVWRDQNRVATISTYHGNDTTESNVKTKPSLIIDYNNVMGSIDKRDQMLAVYPIERKRNKIWYKKLFRRLLNVSVLNSFIIARKSSSVLDHRTFRESLVCSLLHRHCTSQNFIDRPVPSNVKFFDAREHHIGEYPISKSKSRLRRTCCVCKNRTHFYCVGCQKTACLNVCFVALHTK